MDLLRLLSKEPRRTAKKANRGARVEYRFRLAPAVGGMVMLGREKGGLRLSGMGGGRAELKGAGMDGAVHRLH